MPPNETHPLKVTKSPVTAPCAVSVAVIVESLFVAENDISLLPVVERIGVMSVNVFPPSSR